MRHDSTRFGPDSLRVLYFGTYRANYSRNRIMIEGLRRDGVTVEECHEPLWRGIEDRVALASGGWKRPGFWWRAARAYLRLLWRGLRADEYDVMVVGYPGQFDVFLARLLSGLRRRPLAWDIFMSIYLIALERGLDRKSAFTVRMLHRVEKLALSLPDRLIHDTAAYTTWLCETYNISPERFRLVPTGADDRQFFPRPAAPSGEPLFEVLYYGTFIPNHGVDVMIEAARLLEGEPGIRFTLVGGGPEQAAAKNRAAGLGNVRFIDWLEKDALAERIAAADLCLGAFGQTPQSLMTVQNKIYECLAMRKTVLTGDSPAARQAFTHGEHLFLCERAPTPLAEAIRMLRGDPAARARAAEQGYTLFQEQYSLDRLGARFAGYLREMARQA
jgi:glycosyltransferase involved in cell wall biosynthesis